ncbi:5-carboxymethyl-2-hydroxymuconate Delta-isomerase [Streptomyces kunmingensis]|uniref:5-carboxymethyl-2-hydroxymuconate Delta-isomerase n=1 Tax=Streptomyces kunmingensis TaxID=68225 RepID=A0ABU6C323_9ACTN|nr:5-carboxymethyl-2-hydroxymuconate Delta-isomerase [Streptomyces kunmingensis]MEB3959064.1 5-carboxymethyl-2-hydroxymuconate Delta-isomerase [Streptomyces kunmingensis]
MPQITVDHSADLDGRLDRTGLAGAVHQACVDLVAARIPACKTRFRRAEETIVGDGAEEAALVHIEIALLAGRTEEAKTALTEAVLALLPGHIKAAEGVHLSVEVRDLEPAYRSARG